MKKYLGFLILLIGSSAMATSILPHGRTDHNIRLRYERTPTAFAQDTADYAKKVITVRANGEVTYRFCAKFPQGAHSTRPCTTTFIARLTAHRMDKIERDIRAAEFGSILDNSRMIRCRAIPGEHENFTADGGSALLKDGAVPCGGMTWNDSVAAKRLVVYLQNLMLKADR